MPTDKKLFTKEIALKGKLITWLDPALVVDNFQQLKNMRYWGDHLRSIAGMSKINTSVMSSAYLRAISGIHYRKYQPQETHVLVEAQNSAKTASVILDNKATIPNQGNFESAIVYTPTVATGGVFSVAPKNTVVYCNGTDVCIFGGDEFEVGAFYVYDPSDSFSYDYTDRVNNTKSDSSNVALLYSASSDISDAVLLLHFDNNVTDSSLTTPHTVTNNGVTFSSSDYKFGGYSAVFDGSASYLSIADDSDFDFSVGTLTIESWIKVDSLSTNNPIYYQQSDSERYCSIYVNTSGGVTIRLYNNPTTTWTASTAVSVGDAVIPTISNGYFYECTVAGTTDSTEPTWTTTVDSTVVDGSAVWKCKKITDTTLSTASSLIATDTWYYLEVVCSSDTWYVFINGYNHLYESVVDGLIDYSGDVYIGYDTSDYFDGKMDEYVVWSSAKHTSNFEPPSSAYSASSSEAYMYIGSIMPIIGFKPYIQSANTTTSTVTGYYWNGTDWFSMTLSSDGTSSGGVTFAQTGTVLFSTNVANHRVRYLNGMVLFWYKIKLSAISSNTSIYYLTLKTSFQPLQDIWDGVRRSIDSFQVYVGNNQYNDYTLEVREEKYTYNEGDTWTEKDSIAEIDGLITCHNLVFGFQEPMMGVSIKFVPGYANTASGAIAIVEYWDGDEWKSVGNVIDGTYANGTSFAQSGVISWDHIDIQNLIKRDINNSTPFYFYRIRFTKTLSSAVKLYYVTGIPQQRELANYAFPLFAHNRLWLCDNTTGKRNTAICSVVNSPVAFNGEESVEYEFGNEEPLTGGAWLYSQYGSSLYNVALFFKASETWAVVGNDPESWVKYRVSGTVGCVAPNTIKVVDLMPTANNPVVRNIAIWQAADGIYISDGRTPVCISDDIRDKFDPNSDTCINFDNMSASYAEWDNYNQEYHWIYCSKDSTEPDKEFVYSFKKNGWFEIERPSDKKLQCLISVQDADNNQYMYGLSSSGYMYRLEHGTDFDGTAITSTFQFGDIALAEGSIMLETVVEYAHLVAVAKSSVSQISVTHYGDSSTTGTTYTYDSQKSGYRLLLPVHHKSLGAHIFHSWKFEASSSSEFPAFEPLFFGILFRSKRNHTRDWR